MLKFFLDLAIAWLVIYFAGELAPHIERLWPWGHELITAVDEHLLTNKVVTLALLIRFYRIDANTEGHTNTHVKT